MRIRSRILFIAVAVGLAALLSTILAFGASHKGPGDEQIVTIKGKVTILNHPSLGQTKGNGVYLVFQKVGCNCCLIGTRADLDGNYEIDVSRGRYKVIVQDKRGGGDPTYDLLAPGQQRIVDATSVIEDNTFDVRLVLPKD